MKPSILFWLAFGLVCLSAPASTIVLDKPIHIGTPGVPEWREFAGREPVGMNHRHTFKAKANDELSTLLIWQDDVKNGGWQIRLNGKGLGRLATYETKVVHTLEVPSGTLLDGENVLEIIGPKSIDDIVLDRMELHLGNLADCLSGGGLKVAVTEDGQPVPCRITIVDADGFLVPLLVKPDPSKAVRPGVVYTMDGSVSANLRPGQYTCYATRGFEYSRATQTVEIKGGAMEELKMSITREVPMPGYVSCDTHIHVRTFSGHGDSTAEERIPTIAGEHIEFAVATDHNVHADYRPFQKNVEAEAHFTAVIGNEVTTSAGHFNIFPIDVGHKPADHKTSDWQVLMQRMRSTPGVQVVQLNHPRNVHSNFSPTSAEHFNYSTGRNLRGPQWSFDAFEVITSAALQDDLHRLFRDWFGVLNHGHRITGLGSSDTHDVSRYILGQGRTYVACDDTNPSLIPVDQLCRNLRAGKALFGMGLLADVKVNGRYGVGDLATKLGQQIEIKALVYGPSWAGAESVALYLNGEKVRETKLEGTQGKGGLQAEARFVLPRPRHDAWLVVVARGPMIDEPCWELPRPYQHKGIDLDTGIIGASNPVWLDCDADNQFTSAREYGEALYKRYGTDLQKLIHALASHDAAIASQVADLLQQKDVKLLLKLEETLVGHAAPHIRKGFQSFRSALSDSP